MSRPEYFNVDFKMNNYTFYRNKEGRVYVPETKAEFNDFIDALYGIIIDPTDEQKKNYELIKKYPFLLPKNRWDKGLTIDGNYGFDFDYTEIDAMPKGWFIAFGMQMVDELNEALGDLAYEYMITDIKEKYGTLRWYDNGNTEAGFQVINKYTNLSEVTCIICGKPATKISAGWISPYCDKHFDSRWRVYAEVIDGKIEYEEE